MKRLLLTLIILLSPVMALLPNDTASAWVASYNYRKAFYVNGSADGVLTNYQLKITVNNSSGVSTGSTVYLNGSSLAWPNDFRFTNSSDTNLDFWIESNTSTEATVWVEFNSIASGATTQSLFYIYYGNAGASTVSNGSNTFPFFDHFDGDLGKWQGSTSACSIASSIVTLTANSSTLRAIYPSGSATAGDLAMRTSASLSNADYPYLGLSDSILKDCVVNLHNSGATNHTKWVTQNNYVATTISNQDAGFGAYHIYDYIRLLTGTDTAKVFMDNAQVGSSTTTNVPTVSLYPFLGAGNNGVTVSADWVLLRAITPTEPYIGIWEIQESLCVAYLTTSSSAGGNVTTPGEGTYLKTCNESVSIVATADACYHFINWTGDTGTIANVSAASTTINMSTSNKSIIANFAINVSTITYVAGANGTINGTSPQTLNCGNTTSAVTAVANTCYYFVNWSDASTTNPRTDVAISTNQTFTANFALVVYGSPSSLTSYADANSVNIAWAKGTNTSETVIIWKIDNYSISIADGNLIANQSGYSYTHTGLLAGTSYYYTLWGKNGSCLSSGYSQIMRTTTAGSTADVTPNPLPTSDTTSWFGTPNASALENNPLYPAINQMADGIGMPHKTWWILITVGAMVMAGIIVFVKTDNLLLSILVSLAICVVAAVKIFLLPVWFAIVMVLITVGFGWKEIR